MNGLTRWGRLVAELDMGHERTDVTRDEMLRLCRTYARAVPRRYVRAREGTGCLYRVALVGGGR